MEPLDSLGILTTPLQPRSKRPLFRDWLSGDARAWARAPPDANVGVLCGHRSGGLVVIDFDSEAEYRAAIERPLGDLARDTIVVKTHRGAHVYTRHDGPTRNIEVTNGTHNILVRGEGGMVVAPPSTHPNGTTYVFVGQTERILPLRDVWPAAARAMNQPHAPKVRRRETHQRETISPDIATVDAAKWDAIFTRQAPRLAQQWTALRDGTQLMDDSGSGTATRADYAIAMCLLEHGACAKEAALVLLSLPGSKAAQRGEHYAIQTATRAQARRANL